ncbi:hypothetical protein [Streptomyces sp. NPDC059468]|uniref:hypothetical protein n=1 Tax=Streptomyces sp. NPDC059468 TaxID=3346845 RepID=UPI00367D9B8D
MRGYADQNERVQKQRHMQVLKARLAAVEQKIAAGRPSITVGGRSLARLRHHLADAHLTEADWRQRWEAERLFLTADGESDAPHGNYTITVDPSDGSVTLVLPSRCSTWPMHPRAAIGSRAACPSSTGTASGSTGYTATRSANRSRSRWI